MFDVELELKVNVGVEFGNNGRESEKRKPLKPLRQACLFSGYSKLLTPTGCQAAQGQIQRRPRFFYAISTAPCQHNQLHCWRLGFRFWVILPQTLLLM
jgi:hypothetical protein